MLDTILLSVLTLNLVFMAAWLTVGALENLFHPFLNETYTAQVMDMEVMRNEYPKAYAHVAYRRVTHPGLRRAVFRFIVTLELLATLALWAAVGAALLALSAAIPVETALAAALAATALFGSIWAGFLVAGNYFCYWFGHEGGQNTHFQMLLWALANLILQTVISIGLL